jgi:hypothetical protein
MDTAAIIVAVMPAALAAARDQPVSGLVQQLNHLELPVTAATDALSAFAA